LDGPFEKSSQLLSVEKPKSLDFDSVREYLAHVVPLCLDTDPSLIPVSCGGTGTVEANSEWDGTTDARDPDDFSFWSERQAMRISTAIEEAFGLEYAPEVVMAHANLTALANRILVSKQVLVTTE